MLNGAPVTPPQLNMRGALDRSRLRTLLAARREAPLETTPLHLLRAIACTSMVSARMPMVAIAEAMQP